MFNLSILVPAIFNETMCDLNVGFDGELVSRPCLTLRFASEQEGPTLVWGLEKLNDYLRRLVWNILNDRGVV